MKPRLFPLVLLLAGCGGASTSSFVEATSGSLALSFAPGTGYNGGSATLSAYDSLNGSAAGNAIEATVVRSGRTVAVSLIGSSLSAGTVVDLSTDAGSSMAYSDSNGQWTATGGAVSITTRTSSSIVLTFNNVVLTANGNGAAGTVTINGTLTFTMA